MKHFTLEEYIALCNELEALQYSELEEAYTPYSTYAAPYIPVTPPATAPAPIVNATPTIPSIPTIATTPDPYEYTYTKPLPIINNNLVMNITKFSTNEIKDCIKKCNNFEVGNFIIKVKRLKGKFILLPYETKNKISVKINIKKDIRFNTQNWVKYFSAFGDNQIAENDLVLILKYFTFINKNKCFI